MLWDPRLPAGNYGFTLIELVMVIVILGILALGTTRYIVQSTEQYTVSAERAKLIAGGRVAVEKVTRRLRNALPNSVRVGGDCIEYFPVLAATSSLGVIPVPVDPLLTAQFTLTIAPTNYAVIAPMAPSELYNPSPGASVIVQTTINSPNTYNNIGFGGGHTFLRTSPTERVYLAGEPERFCIAGTTFTFSTGYGIEANINDPISGATTVLIAENLAAGSGFQYTPGTLVRNALVQVDLNFLKNGDPVNLNHEVQIRNVP